MAQFDDLIAHVRDPALRAALVEAHAGLRRQTRFGLVFEEHIPETVALLGLPIQEGSVVQRRDEPQDSALFRVRALDGHGLASLEPLTNESASTTVNIRDLMVVRSFGEPIYPALTSLGRIGRGDARRPHHAVIKGENLHALQLFSYLYEQKVDCIYLDPPYNTGARDWKYNNRYVDEKDGWRHSKWLSYMERRLRLARRLLKPDGVLIVTIDEHEVHHLGMLLERIFPEYLRPMVTIVMNPKGTGKLNFARVDEYAMFCIPNLGRSVVTGTPVEHGKVKEKQQTQGTLLAETTRDTDADEDEIDVEVEGDEESEEGADEVTAETASALPFPPEEIDLWERRHARRRGGESSYRHQRPNQFYPIYVDPKRGKVVRVGSAPAPNEPPDLSIKNGLKPVWPIDSQGLHRCWRLIAPRMQGLIDEGRVVTGRYNPEQDSWTLNLWVRRAASKKLKTVWWDSTHDAGTHGTTLLHKMLGRRNAFPFPKSVYAVQDCLAAVVRDRPKALIMDVFAGSGTTFHATCLLNAQDGGERRCILVTNNEVAEKTAKSLNARGVFRGDDEFERHGIFEQATRPRCEATVTGRHPDGKLVAGAHADGRLLSLGFDENVEFFRVDYLDPDSVGLGHQLNSILPLLWLAAGGVGERPTVTGQESYLMPPSSTFAILLRESGFRLLRRALADRPDVTHVWLVTDSEAAFAEMRSVLPQNITTSMLYRDYLQNFRVNTRMT